MPNGAYVAADLQESPAQDRAAGNKRKVADMPFFTLQSADKRAFNTARNTNQLTETLHDDSLPLREAEPPSQNDHHYEGQTPLQTIVLNCAVL